MHGLRNQQRLHGDRAVGERVLELLVQNALVRGVHVDDHEAVRVLRQHIDAVDLAEREAERLLVGGVERGRRVGADALYGDGVSAAESRASNSVAPSAVPAFVSLRPNSAS